MSASPTRTRWRTSLLVAPLIAGAALVAVPNQAQASTTTVTELPQKGRAGTAWLAGNRLHTPAGRVVTLKPWTAKSAADQSLRLIGRTDSGWLLRSFSGGYLVKVWLYRNSERTLVTSAAPSEGDSYSYSPADDGSGLIKIYNDGAGSSTASALGLDGDVLASVEFSDEGVALAFSGTQAVLNRSDTHLWTVGSDPVALGVDTLAANLAADLVVVDVGNGTGGPTALSSPAEPEWLAPMTWAALSPDGAWVVNSGGTTNNRLSVHDVATGTLKTTVRLRHRTGEPVWDTDRSFVFTATTRRGATEALVRCTVRGTCARVSDYEPSGTLSIAGN